MLRDDKIEFLTKDTPEAEIARIIDSTKRNPLHRRQLLEYLPQQHRIYQGRSANETIRIRAYLFESFAHTGLSERALPFVLEALETGRHAYLVAGAAISLRGLPAPRIEVVPFLLKAACNMKFLDDAVSFESYRPRWPLTNDSTALLEIFRTLQWMGSCAFAALAPLKEFSSDVFLSDRVRSEIETTISAIEEANTKCCQWFISRSVRDKRFQAHKALTGDIAEVVLEDQDERAITFKEYFSGRPAIVVFFYTRCDNPNKCSLTITRLGQLQTELAAEGLEGAIKIAAITYDPAYDRPFRLQSFCQSRGMRLDDENRAFRSETGTAAILSYFDAGVNFIGSIVNQHSTELYILDRDGNVSTRFLQLQWRVPEVIGQLRKLLQESDRPHGVFANFVKSKASDLWSSLLSLLIICFPKCPFCAAAYLSALGITNIQILRLSYQLLPIIAVLLFINLFSLFKRAETRNGLLPFYLSLAGVLCNIFLGLLLKITAMSYLGTGLALAGALLNSVDRHTFNWIRAAIVGFWDILKLRIARQFAAANQKTASFPGSAATQRLGLLFGVDQEPMN